ncbi:MAG: chemotaxis protein CheA, partial [Gammaproteobacteria bacterium]|nr:chemotaxis protein CheA [Gammaproteobacteria bacterium]
MSVDLNDEIMQDFLIEASEILETLNEQLVDLEQTPEDGDLLNSIFRGFHTIKGGASFLSLTNLVEVCHKAEDVFNLLRNDELALDADMMDAFLRVLDEVNAMFEKIRAGEDPDAAPPELLQQLQEMQDPQAAVSSEVSADDAGDAVAPEADAVESDTAAADESAGNDITDDEFEALLDSLHGDGSGPGAKAQDEASRASSQEGASADAANEITDDEFEGLLDSLHGKGTGPTGKADSADSAKADPDKTASSSGVSTPAEEISDDEFEAMLDNMHGKGKGPVAAKKPDAVKKQAVDNKPSSSTAETKAVSKPATEAKTPAPAKATPAP